jgi:hypothetical protein
MCIKLLQRRRSSAQFTTFSLKKPVLLGSCGSLIIQRRAEGEFPNSNLDAGRSLSATRLKIISCHYLFARATCEM